MMKGIWRQEKQEERRGVKGEGSRKSGTVDEGRKQRRRAKGEGSRMKGAR